MKRTLYIMVFATILLAACNSEKKNNFDTDKRLVFTDTSLLKPSNLSTDRAMEGENEQVVAQQEKRQAPKTQIRTITKVIRVVEKEPAPTPIANPTATTKPQEEAPAPAPIETGNNTSNNDATVKHLRRQCKRKKEGAMPLKGQPLAELVGQLREL